MIHSMILALIQSVDQINTSIKSIWKSNHTLVIVTENQIENQENNILILHRKSVLKLFRLKD